MPYQLSELSGDLPLQAGTWSLDFYRALAPASHQPAALSLTAHLPPDGRLEVWATAPRPSGGLGLVLSRIGAPSATVVTRGAGGDRPLRCDAPLPAPAQRTPVQITPTQTGATVTVAGQTVTCAGLSRGGGPALRPGLRRVLVSELSIDGTPVAPPGPRLRPLWWLAGAALGGLLALAEVALGARAALIALTSLPLLLAGWLAPRDLQSWAEAFRAPWLDPSRVALHAPLLLAAAAKLTHHLGRLLTEPVARRPWWLAALAAAPVALVAATSGRGLPTAGIVGLLLAGAAATAALAPRLLAWLGSRAPHSAALWICAAGTVLAGAAGALGLTHQIAAPLAWGAGAAWGLLVWANANPQQARGYNFLSLTAALLVLAAAEGALRYTPVGVAWSGAGSRTRQDDLYGWVDVANEEFQLLEAGEHTQYPDKGFPVAFPTPGGAARIVAMGGSTTGGAYQNDDLSEFYPARLAERLPGRFEVLNQGVGGWTTWHIRQYLGDQLDALRPDVLTLYVGHNDALTRTPLPYKELHAAWKRGSGAGRAGAVLGQLRLYQGLRFFLLSLAGDAQRVAVPLADAEDNLVAIADMVTARGGKVVLASEGLSPDPGPLADYNAMMARLADERASVAYVDTAGALYAQSGQPMFLDDCHLTDAGHRLVAEALHDTLSELIDVSAR